MNKPEILNWIRAWEPGNDKLNYVICIFLSRDNGKITRKEISKLFFQNYYRYVMVKCPSNVNLKEMDTELVQQEKIWILSTVRNI